MIDLPDTSGYPHATRSVTGTQRVVALDGFRAIGLLLIMGYHFGMVGMPGGFVGVDAFYVLSGYLITGLLLGEWARAARIKLGAFWLRRARRLLPALLVVLIVVTLVVRFAYPAGLYPNLRLDDLSALFYFSNWWQIADSGNYFVATGAISPLTHTWSLAVEEQFYLVWPLVVLAVLHVGKKFDRGIELLLGVSLAGVIASATEMFWLYGPRANITRLYFGTDTHAQSILVGAVLACALTLVQRRRGEDGMAPVARSTPARVAWTVVGLAGFAGTLALTYTLSGTAAFAYRGGFLLSALSAAAIILGAVCVTGGPIARVLSVRPLVWMGTVSYGAYLWHYPVFIELDSSRTGTGGASLLAIRMVATFALATASYYLVERPVLEGVFWKSVKATGPALVAMAVTVAVVVAGTTSVASAGVATTVPVRSTTSIRAALPRAVHARLESAGAFSTDPIRFLLLGDSLAITSSVGLAAGSVVHFGVQVIDQGSFGCDYDTSVAISEGQHVVPLNDCLRWRTLYADEMARSHPEVVGLLTGRWSITDRVVGGEIVHVGQPAWDDHLVTEYTDIVRFLAPQGVGVVLFTLPYFAPPQEAPDGSIYPENRPDRVVAFNRDLARVAAVSRGKVTLMDLTALLCPHGHFQTVVDGVTARWSDGVHVTPAGGVWLQPRVLPTVAELGLAVRSRATR
jgi:peptidoglycan/LPS O-acetylase OafA/YrhL